MNVITTAIQRGNERTRATVTGRIYLLSGSAVAYRVNNVANMARAKIAHRMRETGNFRSGLYIKLRFALKFFTEYNKGLFRKNQSYGAKKFFCFSIAKQYVYAEQSSVIGQFFALRIVRGKLVNTAYMREGYAEARRGLLAREIKNMIVVFAVVSVLGWVAETLACYPFTGWQDRGFLTMPMCTIYGTAAVFYYCFI